MPPTIIYHFNTSYYFNGFPPSSLHPAATTTSHPPVITYTMTTTTTTTDSPPESPTGGAFELPLPEGFLGHPAIWNPPGLSLPDAAASSSVANSPFTPEHDLPTATPSMAFAPTEAAANADAGGVWDSILSSSVMNMSISAPDPETPPPSPSSAHGFDADAPPTTMSPLQGLVHLPSLPAVPAQAAAAVDVEVLTGGAQVEVGKVVHWKAMIAHGLERAERRLPISPMNLFLTFLVLAAFLY
ncbi:hypothetical protein BV25DRAFT_1918438 [Artomyces pyxidatus]|uniref:Uncharacterized protein n=1 Tax=Artomyces pyxidatus TaxID=48021 RepID=A0ACB8ST63_9AGAM|nr:hypothetical protein BV25DRAFT_1918438 [Artomyces pyxidatus]